MALCITSTFQTANGLGQHEATLSAKQLQAYQKVFSSVLLHGLKLTRKATFATDITYTTTLITSKLSVIWFLHTLTLQRVHNHLRRALGLLVIAWGVSGLFAIAFQCPVPDTWQVLSQRCFHQVRHQFLWPCRWRQLLNIPHRCRSGTILPFPTLSSNWLS